jgi:arabinogalactan endo-1,4-beta-galactosidase
MNASPSGRSIHSGTRQRIGLAAVVLAAVTLVPAAAMGVPGNLLADSHNGPPRAALSVNLALGAAATASSAATGEGPELAVDGSATTMWCATAWPGTLSVDLGSVRSLDGIGVTLGATASASRVSIQLARSPGVWTAVPSAQSLALNGNTPSYLSLPRGSLARYAQITVSTGDGSAACIGEFRLFGHSSATDQMDLGADLSFAPQEQSAGTVFTDAGRPGTPVQILKAHGGNFVRMRLWVDPPAGYSDLATDLALARQVRAAGMKVYLDIHYSDFWADPQHEDNPAAWQGQDLATLSNTVQSYTASVIKAFARQGTPVSLVSIGNEIRNGMLWPVGQVDWTADTGWDNLATLLKAGIRGARSANPHGNQLRIMIHFDEGGNNVDSTRFFNNLIERGVAFDVIGLSYYTFFHGPVTALRDNVDALATHFGKDIMIAELQYAWTLANGDFTGNFVWQPSQVEPGYPASPGGQLSIVSDVLSILAAAPGHHGAGLFYWEPEWVPGVGWEPGAGAPNDNLTLYDFQGRALPSIGIFENPVNVCLRQDAYSVPCVL